MYQLLVQMQMQAAEAVGGAEVVEEVGVEEFEDDPDAVQLTGTGVAQVGAGGCLVTDISRHKRPSS